MATQSTSTYIKQAVHKKGIASSTSSPTITAKFTITFKRVDGSSTVTWSTSGMGNSTHSSGKFGYNFFAYIAVCGGTSAGGSKQSILTKDANNPNWNDWSTHNRSGSFTATSNKATVTLYVKNRSNCKHSEGTKWCFNGSGTYYKVKSITCDIPEYESFYDITYDSNSSGAPVSNMPEPNPQTNSTLQECRISNSIPVFPITNTYRNNPNVELSANRQFNDWNTSDDGTGTTYAPGALYTAKKACTLYARWLDAIFSTDNKTIPEVPDNYIHITYNYNGGQDSQGRTGADRPAKRLGYDESATEPEPPRTYPEYPYDNQDKITISTSVGLNLYPIYGEAELLVSDMPKPPELRKPGYRFIGWKDANGNDIVTKLVTKVPCTIYAQWEPIPLHQYHNGWDDKNEFVWRYHESTGTWVKEAHIFGYDESEGTWTDRSV